MEQVEHSIRINPHRTALRRRVGFETHWVDLASARGVGHLHGAPLAVLALLKRLLAGLLLGLGAGGLGGSGVGILVLGIGGVGLAV